MLGKSRAAKKPPGASCGGTFGFARDYVIMHTCLHAYLGRVFQRRYGLGTCYLRKSKIRMAEYHYRKAAEIHPNNAVLLGCVGMVRFESVNSFRS